MIRLPSLILCILSLSSCMLWQIAHGQMIGAYGSGTRLLSRQNRNGNNDNDNDNNNGNNNGPDLSGFTIDNGRILTPGLAILLAPQPFTPMGGDFLHIAMDVAADGKLNVPPRDRSDPITQVYNYTLFLTSFQLQKNFTISNLTTTTPPLADIMNQEPGQTVKHINFEWPLCLVGDGQDDEIGITARGDYNISIHQNYRLDGSDHYSIFNLPISVTNSISQFPGAGQLTTKPIPGPLNANGGRVNCEAIENPLIDFQDLVRSVNNPPGQPYQDIEIETSGGGGGGVGGPGTANPNNGGNSGDNDEGNFGGSSNNGGNQGIGNQPGDSQGSIGAGVRNLSLRCADVAFIAAFTVLGSSIGW